MKRSKTARVVVVNLSYSENNCLQHAYKIIVIGLPSDDYSALTVSECRTTDFRIMWVRQTTTIPVRTFTRCPPSPPVVAGGSWSTLNWISLPVDDGSITKVRGCTASAAVAYKQYHPAVVYIERERAHGRSTWWIRWQGPVYDLGNAASLSWDEAWVNRKRKTLHTGLRRQRRDSTGTWWCKFGFLPPPLLLQYGISLLLLLILLYKISKPANEQKQMRLCTENDEARASAADTETSGNLGFTIVYSL